jgi:hypothetical protein
MNLVEMGGLIALLSKESCQWQLLRMVTGTLPNVRSKAESGVQHNGMNSYHCIHVRDENSLQHSLYI